MKKYEMLKDQSLEYEGRKLYRIRALVDFKCHEGLFNNRKIKAGDIGGYIEKESNLSHDIDDEYGSWVGDDAKVMDNAVVSDVGVVLGSSVVKDNAVIQGCALVKNKAVICDNVILDCVLIETISDDYVVLNETYMLSKALENDYDDI